MATGWEMTVFRLAAWELGELCGQGFFFEA